MTAWEQPQANAGMRHIDSSLAATVSLAVSFTSCSQTGTSSGMCLISCWRHSARLGRSDRPWEVYQEE